MKYGWRYHKQNHYEISLVDKILGLTALLILLIAGTLG